MRQSKNPSPQAIPPSFRSPTTETSTSNRPPTAPRADRASPVTVKTSAQGEFVLDHGAVAIASITSCTNTSNPSVMLGAALLARNAVEKGLASKPWVKTSMAPGSQVVTDYYNKAGLWPYLEKLGFFLVGYGCTTCIGNSGPLTDEISAAINDNDLTVTAVLSGNRNFEGRISPDVKMNYLASPPLVIAYALAGTMDFDFETDPLGTGQGRQRRLPEGHLAEPEGNSGHHQFVDQPGDVHQGLRGRLQGRRVVALASDARRQYVSSGTKLHVRAQAPYFDGMPKEPEPVSDIQACAGARAARRLGHHRPHLAGRGHQAGHPCRPSTSIARHRAQGLQLLRIATRQPRGDDAGHVANIRPRNDCSTTFRRLHPRLHPGRRPAGVHLRCVAELPEAASRWWCSAARSTVRAPRATGRPRAPCSSGFGP